MSAPHVRRLVLGSAGVISLLLLGTFLYTASCGYHGCPSRAEIRAYRPAHGTVPLARIPENVRGHPGHVTHSGWRIHRVIRDEAQFPFNIPGKLRRDKGREHLPDGIRVSNRTPRRHGGFSLRVR